MSWLATKIAALTAPDAPVVTTRALDGSVFQPHATKACQVDYTIQQVATAGQDGMVKLLCDAANPPTTECGEVRNASTGGGTIAHSISYIVPAGFNCKLVKTGNTTDTITQQSETPIN